MPTINLVPGQLYAISYRTRALGHGGDGVEDGTIEGRWTGAIDHWGKYTILDMRAGSIRYLFADEILSTDPLDEPATPAPAGDAAHAPGPWTVARDQDGNLLILAADSAEQGIVATVNAARGGPQPDGKANARVLAAAPELAALLRRLVQAARAFDPAADGSEAFLTFAAEAQSRIPNDARALLARIDGQEPR